MMIPYHHFSGHSSEVVYSLLFILHQSIDLAWRQDKHEMRCNLAPAGVNRASDLLVLGMLIDILSPVNGAGGGKGM